jgi:hypothetical protein
MNKYTETDCRNLETRYDDCGRLVCSKILPKDEWISIKNESAPKNGEEFLGYEQERIFVFSYRYGDWHECSNGEIACVVNPSHWMPLPTTPKE